MDEQSSEQQPRQQPAIQQFSLTPGKVIQRHGISFWLKILAVVLIVGGGIYFAYMSTNRNSSPDMVTLQNLLIKDKNYAAAENLALKMEKQFPNNVDIQLVKGEAEISMREYDRATATYKQILTLDPTNATALSYIAMIPKLQSVATKPQIVPQYSNATAKDVESRLGITFDTAVLKFDSGYFSGGTGSANASVGATYESTESVNDVAAYLGKTLPPPLVMASDGQAVEFQKTTTKTNPVSYIIRIEVRNGKTTVTISYSKAAK